MPALILVFIIVLLLLPRLRALQDAPDDVRERPVRVRQNVGDGGGQFLIHQVPDVDVAVAEGGGGVLEALGLGGVLEEDDVRFGLSPGDDRLGLVLGRLELELRDRELAFGGDDRDLLLLGRLRDRNGRIGVRLRRHRLAVLHLLLHGEEFLLALALLLLLVHVAHADRDFAVLDGLGDRIGRRDLPDQRGLDHHALLRAAVLDAGQELLLELLPGDAPDEVPREVLRPFDPAVGAGVGKNDRLGDAGDDVPLLHVLREDLRNPQGVDVPLDRPLHRDVEAVQGRKADDLVSHHVEAVRPDVDRRDLLDVRVFIVRPGRERVLLDSPLAVLDQELVRILGIRPRHQGQHADVAGFDRDRWSQDHGIRERIDDVAAGTQDVGDDAAFAGHGDDRVLGDGLAPGPDLETHLVGRDFGLVADDMVPGVWIPPVPAFRKRIGLDALLVARGENLTVGQIVAGLADEDGAAAVLDDDHPGDHEDAEQEYRNHDPRDGEDAENPAGSGNAFHGAHD